jgi:hypothetical protein
MAHGLTGATAHSVDPDSVVRELRAPAVRERFDVTAVARHADLPRLLVIRVGTGWHRVAAGSRREAAETWLARWRHATPQGIVAILDDASGRSLVNFDVGGRALLEDERAGARDDRPVN